MKKIIRDALGKDDGSAIVEFIVLALPLFLPLFLYLNQYSEASDVQSSFRTLAREMARGFVTSENNEIADRVANEIFLKGAGILGFNDEVKSGDLTYKYICRESPCISPDNEIVLEIHSRRTNTSIQVIEYVSPWA